MTLKRAEEVTKLVLKADKLYADIEYAKSLQIKPSELKAWEELYTFHSHESGRATHFPPLNEASLEGLLKNSFPLPLLNELKNYTALFGYQITHYYQAYEEHRKNKQYILLEYDHLLRNHAYRYGKEALARRQYIAGILTQKYHRLSIKKIDSIIEKLTFYLTLSTDYKIPYTAKIYYDIKSHPKLNKLDDKSLWEKPEDWRKPGANYYFERWTTPESKNYGKQSKAAKDALLTYLGYSSLRAAINELYLCEPILIALRRAYEPSKLAANIILSTEKFRLRNIRLYIDNILSEIAEGNRELEEVLGKDATKTNWQTLAPLLKQSAVSLEQTTTLDKKYLQQALNDRLQKKENQVAKGLDAASYVFTAVAMFCAGTPFAIPIGAVAAIVNLSNRFYLFYLAAGEDSARTAINKYPDGGGMIKIAESPAGVGDEMALLLIEVIFFVPALKAVKGIKVKNQATKTAKNIHINNKLNRKSMTKDKRKIDSLIDDNQKAIGSKKTEISTAKDELFELNRELRKAERESVKIAKKDFTHYESATEMRLRSNANIDHISAKASRNTQKFIFDGIKKENRETFRRLLSEDKIYTLSQQLQQQQTFAHNHENVLAAVNKVLALAKKDKKMKLSKIQNLEKRVADLELKVINRRSKIYTLEEAIKTRYTLIKRLGDTTHQLKKASADLKVAESKFKKAGETVDQMNKVRIQRWEKADTLNKKQKEVLLDEIQENEKVVTKLISEVDNYEKNVLPTLKKEKKEIAETLNKTIQDINNHEKTINNARLKPLITRVTKKAVGTVSTNAIDFMRQDLQSIAVETEELNTAFKSLIDDIKGLKIEEKSTTIKPIKTLSTEEQQKRVHPQNKESSNAENPLERLIQKSKNKLQLNDKQRGLGGNARSL